MVVVADARPGRVEHTDPWQGSDPEPVVRILVQRRDGWVDESERRARSAGEVRERYAFGAARFTAVEPGVRANPEHTAAVHQHRVHAIVGETRGGRRRVHES